MRHLPLLLCLLPLACAAPTAMDDAAAPMEQGSTLVELGDPDDPARAFDFWLGSWECFGPDGSLGGTNTITLEADGRVLQERWVGAGGGSGTSLNALDAGTGRWHQTWIDSAGGTLFLGGGPDEDGAMVLEGTKARRDGRGDVRHRVTWTPGDEDGRPTVHQVWVWSADGGATWSTAADLVYRRVR